MTPESPPHRVLPPADEKPQFVQALFSRIAPHYDGMNDVMTFGLHRRWKALACRRLGLKSGQRALDVCCGTGDLSRALLRQTPGLHVCGLDFCEAMLAIARQRLAGYPCELVQGDAMALPFDDQTFDGVVVGYGLRNVADVAGCLREMARVLKPGGRLVSLDMSHPSPWMHRLSAFWRESTLPLLGLLLAGDAAAYRYLPQSARAFASQAALADLMTQAGFIQARYENLLGGICALHIAERSPDATRPA